MTTQDTAETEKEAQEARVRQAFDELPSDTSYQFALTWGAEGKGTAIFQAEGAEIVLVLTDHATFRVQVARFKSIEAVVLALREGSSQIDHPGFPSLQRRILETPRGFSPLPQRLLLRLFENPKISDVAAALSKMQKGLYWSGDLWLEATESGITLGQSGGRQFQLDLSLAFKGLAALSFRNTLTVEDERMLDTWLTLLRTPEVLCWHRNEDREPVQALLDKYKGQRFALVRFLLRHASATNTFRIHGQTCHFYRSGKYLSVYRVDGGIVRRDVYTVEDEPPYMIVEDEDGEALRPLLGGEPEAFGLGLLPNLSQIVWSQSQHPEASRWLVEHRDKLDEMVRLGLLKKTLQGRLALDQTHTVIRASGLVWWTGSAPSLTRLQQLEQELKEKLMEENAEKEAREKLRWAVLRQSSNTSQQLIETRGELQIVHLLERAPFRYTTHTLAPEGTQGFTQIRFDSLDGMLAAVPPYLVGQEWKPVNFWCRDMDLSNETIPHRKVWKLLDLGLEPGFYTNGEVSVLCQSFDQDRKSIRILSGNDSVNVVVGSHWYVAGPTGPCLDRGLEMLAAEHASSPTLPDLPEIQEKAQKLWEAHLLKKAETEKMKMQATLAEARTRLLERRNELSTYITLRSTRTEGDVTTEYILEERPDRLFTRSFKGAETLGWTETSGLMGELVAAIPDSLLLSEWSEGPCPPVSSWYSDPTKTREVEILRQLINLRPSLPLNHVFTNGKTTILGPASEQPWWLGATLALKKEGFAAAGGEGQLPGILELFQGEHIRIPVPERGDPEEAALKAWAEHQERKRMAEQEAERANLDKARKELVNRLYGLSCRNTLRCTDTGEDGVSTDYILERVPETLTTRRYKGTETLGWTQKYDDLAPLAAQIPDHLFRRRWAEGACPPHSRWYSDPTKTREVEILRQLLNLKPSLPLNHVFTNGKTTILGPANAECWCLEPGIFLHAEGFELSTKAAGAVTIGVQLEDLLKLFQGEHIRIPVPAGEDPLKVAQEVWANRNDTKEARARLARRLNSMVSTRTLCCTDTGEDGVSTDYILEQCPNTLTTRRYKGTETLGWTQVHDDEGLAPLTAQIPDHLVLREWGVGACPPFCSWYNDPTKARELEIARQLFNLRPTLPLDRVFTNGKVTIVGPETGTAGWTPISGLQLAPLGLRASGCGVNLQDLEGILALFQGEHINIPRSGNSALCAQEAEQAWDKHVKEKQMSTDNQYPHRHLFDAAAQQLEVGGRARVYGASNDGLIWRESENVTVLYLRTDMSDGLRIAALLVTFDKTTGEFKERVYLNPREGQGYDDRRHRVMRGEPSHSLRGEDFKSRLIPFLRQVLENPSAEEVLGRDLSKLAFLHPETSDLDSAVGYLRKQAARVHFGSDEKARFIKLQRLNAKEQVCTVTLTWEDEVPFCRVTSSGEAAWDPELLKSALDELEQTGISGEDGLSPAGKRHLRLNGWGRAPASDDEVRQELLHRATDLSAETRTEMERAFTQLLRSLRGRHIGRLCNYTFRYVDRQLEVFNERRYVDSYSLSSRQKTFSLVDGVRADLIRALSLGPLTEEGIKRSLGIEENGASNFWSTDADVSAPALFAKFFPDRVTRETPPTTTPTPTPSVVTERGKRWDLQDMLPRLKALNEASPSHTQFRGAQGTYVLLKDSATIAAVYLPDNGQIEVCYPNKHALFWANREDSELRALEPREQLHTPEFWASFKQFLDQVPPGSLQRSGPNERRLAEIQMSGPQAKYLAPSDEVRTAVELRQRVGATQLTAWQGPRSGTWVCSPLGVFSYLGAGDLSLGPSLSPLLDGYVARRGGAETLFDFAARMRKVLPLQEGNAHTWTSGNGSTLSYTAMDGQCLAVLAHPDRPPEFIAIIGEDTYSVGDSTSPIRADTFTKYHRRLLSASERAGLEALRGENLLRLTTQQPLANPHVETWSVMKSLRDLTSGMTGPLTGCGIFKMRDGTEAPLNFSLNATDAGRCLRLQATQGEMALEYLYDLGLTFFRGVDLGVDFADLASAILNPKPEEKPAQEPEAEIASVEGATMNSDNTNSPKQAPATGEAKPDAKPSVIDRAKAKVGEIRDQAKEEASEASWRLATKQMVKLVREPLVAFLCRQTGQSADSDFGKKVGEFLGTEAGDALVAGVLAVGLTSLPGNDPRVQRLAREMRVRSMSEVGDMVVDVLMGPLRQVLAQYLSDSGESASPLQLPAASPSASDVLEQAHLDNPLVASMNGHASAGPKN